MCPANGQTERNPNPCACVIVTLLYMDLKLQSFMNFNGLFSPLISHPAPAFALCSFVPQQCTVPRHCPQAAAPAARLSDTNVLLHGMFPLCAPTAKAARCISAVS